MPTGEEKNKLYFCKQGEEGNWHMLGEIKSVESLDEETVGMDMEGCGFSFDTKSSEISASRGKCGQHNLLQGLYAQIL